MSRKPLTVSFLVFAAAATPAIACLWDTDTLQMERLRFPGVLEIITGKFVRHSKAYYEWRIIDRRKKLESARGDAALIDDLAVGYAKLGRHDYGLPLLEKVLETNPNRYETLSNLGTLLFFAGQLDESKQYIRRALEINPNAHFGREKYQLLLMEYLQQSDYSTTGVMRRDQAGGFDTYVLKAEPLAKAGEIKNATTGVLGMMHFADFRSPILLEALGDLLRHGRPEEDATQLAARAYLRAAKFSKSDSAAQRLRKEAHDALKMHEDFGMHNRDGDYLAKLDKALERETADAEGWFAAIEANEKRWIAENRDVDREFATVYYDSLETTLDAAKKQVRGEWHINRPPFYDRLLFEVVGFACVLPLTALLVAASGWTFWRRRQRSYAMKRPSAW